jgi:anti-anti-sigma factor
VDQRDPDQYFSVTASVTAGHALVVVTGEIDMSTADRMYQAAAGTGSGSLTLDLRGVTFFDSAAIHALIRLAEGRPGALRVLPSGQVRRILEISGLDDQPWLAATD